MRCGPCDPRTVADGVDTFSPSTQPLPGTSCCWKLRLRPCPAIMSKNSAPRAAPASNSFSIGSAPLTLYITQTPTANPWPAILHASARHLSGVEGAEPLVSLVCGHAEYAAQVPQVPQRREADSSAHVPPGDPKRRARCPEPLNRGLGGLWCGSVTRREWRCGGAASRWPGTVLPIPIRAHIPPVPHLGEGGETARSLT